ncbi:MAG: hypothetical protein ACLFV3_07115 [Phycisphaeraceae bacterium]
MAKADDTRPRTLLTLRLIWAAMLMSQLVFFLVVAFVLTEARGATPDLHPMLGWIGVGWFVAATAMGYFARNQIYKSAWREHAIAPGGYLTGNLVLLALLESVGLFSIIALLVTGVMVPEILPAIGALVVFAINFPTGHAMRPHPPGEVGRVE